MSGNRRRDLRIGARVPVAIVRRAAADLHQTLDVSFRGMFVETNAPPPVRSLVRLRFDLPNLRLHTHAMVVHVVAAGSDGRAPGMGLQLWALAGSDRQAWEAFVRTLATERRASDTHPAAVETPTPSGIRSVEGAFVPPWKRAE